MNSGQKVFDIWFQPIFKLDRSIAERGFFNPWRGTFQEVAPKIDDDLFIRLTFEVVNSTTRSDQKTLKAMFLALFIGDSKQLLPIMNDNFPKLGLMQSDCTEKSWVESVLFWWPSITSTKALLDRVPKVLKHFKRKSDYVKQPIPRNGLDGIWKLMIELKSPVLTFNPYGGKMAEIPATATPFPHRAGNLWKIQYSTDWDENGTEAANHHIELTRKLYDYMTPYVSKNPTEAFLNYRDLDLGINHNGKGSYLEGRVYGIKYFRDNFNRLVQIKTKVDPGNFFRNEQGIPVSPRSRR